MLSILVIDDSRFLGAILQRALEERGYIVSVVQSILEGMGHVREVLPDLVLLDVNLPGTVQGPEACQKLKALAGSRRLPVVLISGSTREDLGRMASACGAEGFLTKPFQPADLMAWLEAHAHLFGARSPVTADG